MNIKEDALAIVYLVAAVSGASGACLVAAHKVLHGRNISILIFVAYAIVGAVLSVAMVSYLFVFMRPQMDLSEIVLYSIVAGVTGSMALAGTNMTARFIMRRLGIEVDISVKRAEENDR